MKLRQCPVCGARAAFPARCPECGYEMEDPSRATDPGRASLIWGVLAVLLAVAVVAVLLG